MLDGVRPNGARRSWWLRETLRSESPDLRAAAPPLRGAITADVVVLGGGYTGLWTARQLCPHRRCVGRPDRHHVGAPADRRERPRAPIHYGHGYSGNGVAPSVLGGKILAALALEEQDDPVLELPLVGALPRAFPPEPFRYVGARAVREAIVRSEQLEERERRPPRLLRELSRLPRRMGYRLGPE